MNTKRLKKFIFEKAFLDNYGPIKIEIMSLTATMEAIEDFL